MLYDKYYNKIMKIAKIFQTIRRYRVLITVVISAICASIGGFLGVQGMVYDKVECPTAIVYGENFGYEAAALFEDVHYEFSTDAAFSGILDEMPKLPGIYYVRAVSTSSFGNARYGDVYSFTIHPKKVDVSVREQSIVYGELPTVTTELVEGDSITCGEFEYGSLIATETTVAPVKKALKVVDQKGNNVTSGYDFRMISSAIAFEKRQITVTVTNSSHVYDATPFSFDGYQVTDGSMATWGDVTDRVIATFDASLTEVGSVENIPAELRVVTVDGGDATVNYEIKVVSGILTVEQRPIKIQVEDEDEATSFVYDGTEKSYSKYQISAETPLATGHREVLEGYTKLTNAGEVTNLLTFTVKDEKGNDVSANYAIFWAESTLKVNPRPVTVQAPADEWVYDGEEHSNHDFAILATTPLVSGHTAVYYNKVSVKNVGEYSNSVTMSILNADKQNVTSNYVITYQVGTLTVKKRPITVQSDDKEWVYDGTLHHHSEYTITSETKLANNETASVSSYSEITGVGEISNTIVLDIKNASNEYSTANYEITYVDGTLKVTPRPIIVTADSDSKVYDGIELEKNSFTVDNMVAGHTLTASVVGSQKNVGVSENVVDSSTAAIYAGSVEVDLNNYAITYEKGSLEVFHREIYIETPNKEWVYDGTAQSDSNWVYAVDTPYEVANGETAEINSYATITDVGECSNEIVLIIKNANSEDTTANYVITYSNGTLKITPRPITIMTGADSKVYDGTALVNDSYTVDNLATGHTLTATVIGSQTNVGSSENLLDEDSVKIFAGTTEIDLSNYAITYVYGTLTVTKREIHIVTGTNLDGLIYNGEDQSYGEWDYATGTPNKIVSGETWRVDDCTTVKYVTDGEKDNQIVLTILDATGTVDLSANYDVICKEYGKIKINKREIHIVTGTNLDGLIYNGEDQSYGEWDYATGTPNEIVLGETWRADNCTTVKYVTDGEKENRFVLTILDATGTVDLSANYDVVYKEYGKIKINPRPITIVTASDQWIYDGKEHYNSNWEYAEGSLETVFDDEITLTWWLTVTNVWDTATKNSLTGAWEVNSENNLFDLVVLANGVDITENYAITQICGTIEIKQRPVVVKTESYTWEYNGKWHSTADFANKGWEYSNSSRYHFLFNHCLVGTYSEIKNVGSIANVIDLTVVTPDGYPYNLIENYAVTYEYGTLTVTPFVVMLENVNGASWTADEDRWEYRENVALSDTEIVRDPQHHVEELYAFCELDGFGRELLSIKGVILDENNENVIENYAFVHDAYLEILPCGTIRVVTGGAEQVYDGTPLTNSDASFELIDGFWMSGMSKETVQIESTGSITNPGSIKNGYSMKAYQNGVEIELSRFYIIEENLGTLTVRPAVDLFITTGSAAKSFDGTPLTNPEINVDAVPVNNTVEVELIKQSEGVWTIQTTLMDGSSFYHWIYAAAIGEQYPVGSSMNDYSLLVSDSENPDEGQDWKWFYGIVEQLGELEIYPIGNVGDSIGDAGDGSSAVDIQITTGSAEKRYDGTQLTNSEVKVEVQAKNGSDITVRLESLGVETVSEECKIYRFEVTVTLASGVSFTHTISAYADGFTTNPEKMDPNNDNTCVFAILDENGIDVSAAYDIDLILGKLIVKGAADIYVETHSNEKLYDGTPLTDDFFSSEIWDGDIIVGHRVDDKAPPAAIGVQIEAGDSLNDCRYVLLDVNDRDVSLYYDFIKNLGTLTVLPIASLEVWSDDATKPFDGDPLTTDGKAKLDESYQYKDYTVSISDTAQNESLHGKTYQRYVITLTRNGNTYEYFLYVRANGEQIAIGKLDKVSLEYFVLDSEGKDVTNGCFIQVIKEGVLTVDYSAPVLITTGSAQKLYDGDPLTQSEISDFGIDESKLPNGVSAVVSAPEQCDIDGNEAYRYTITLMKNGVVIARHIFEVYCTGEQTEVGESDNDFVVSVYDALNGDASCDLERFQFEATLGTLKVSALAGLHVVTGSNEGDEPPITNGDIELSIVEDSVYPGYAVEVVGTPQQELLDGETYWVYEIKVGSLARTVKTYYVYLRTTGIQEEKGSSENTYEILLLDEEGNPVDIRNYFEISDEMGTLVLRGADDGDNGDGDNGDGDNGDGDNGDGGVGSLDASGNLSGGSLGGGNGGAVFKVKSTITGQFYVRLMSYGNYNGKGFDQAQTYSNILQNKYGYPYLTGLVLQNNGYQAATAEIQSNTSDYLLPYFLAMGDDGSYVIQSDDVKNVGDGSKNYSFLYYLYNGYGGDLTTGLTEYSVEEQWYRDFVHGQYLEIDDETREYMESLILREGFNRLNGDELIAAVAKFIQESATYNLKYDRRLDEEDNIVIAFLSGYQEGICQHYAASATMLFRALGIPARYTIGYAAETKAGEWVSVSGKQAHAWTEVYIDGLGWIPVEVTGSGEFDDPINGEGELPPMTQEIVVKPVDQDKEWDGTPLLPNQQLVIEEGTLLKELQDQGYVFDYLVVGSQTDYGQSAATVEYFRILDAQQNDVTNQFNVRLKEGVLKVTQTQIIIGISQIKKSYDGKVLSYGPDDYWIEKIPDGIRIEFNLEEIELIDVGVLDAEKLKELLVYTVYDANGNIVTDQFFLKLNGKGLEITPRNITLMSSSVTREYTGSALESDQVWISLGSLLDGHKLIAKAIGSITDVGEDKNHIEKGTVQILDANDNDVTDNYAIQCVEGMLKVVER